MNLLKSNIQNILLIENDENRVNWLASVLPFNVNVHHFSVVKEFIEEYPKYKWDLIIFDCDLDPGNKYVFNDDLGIFLPDANMWIDCLDRDSNGHNGVDAVELLCGLKDLDKNVPCLIWSANPDGSREMKEILTKNGFIKVLRKPYGHYEPEELKEIVLDLL